jgi:hypothetical protein
MCKLVVALVAILSLFTPFTPATAGDHSGDLGCEPGGGLNVAALRHSIIDEGATARVTVDLKIHHESNAVRAVVIDGRIVSNGARRAMPVRQASLQEGRHGKLRFTFDLEQGVLHDLEFQVRSALDPAVRSTASLRVDLDPERQPVRLPGVVQYQAQMQGGAQ